MSFEDNPADDDPHGECRHEIEQLQAFLGRVYDQCGNHRPAEYRHRLTPGLRDDIRDYLKTTDHFSPKTIPDKSYKCFFCCQAECENNECLDEIDENTNQ